MRATHLLPLALAAYVEAVALNDILTQNAGNLSTLTSPSPLLGVRTLAA